MTGDPLTSEFDVFARWTEEAVGALGQGYAVAAGCRGSGSPSSLAWLAESMEVSASSRMLDVGSGVGGPAGWLAERFGTRSTCLEPMLGAASAGRRLFGLSTVVSSAEAIPFATDSFDAIWSLGVLCTIKDKLRVLSEAHRVLVPGGRLGLLVFVLDGLPTLPVPEGNSFPSRDEVLTLCERAGFTVLEVADTRALPDAPLAWQAKADRVDAWVRAEHGHDPRWEQAQQQADRIGALLAAGELQALLLHAVST